MAKQYNKTAQRMHRAGLRRATMEGKCVSKHAAYLRGLGYAFCPWCAAALIVQVHCDKCERDFLSQNAYQIHLDHDHLELLNTNPCPNYNGGDRHPIRWLKNRQVFFCPACQIEYPQQDQEKIEREWEPTDTRSRQALNAPANKRDSPDPVP